MTVIDQVQRAIGAMEVRNYDRAMSLLVEAKEQLQRDGEERVKLVAGLLSYSEGEAVRAIAGELEGDDGLIVTSKLADANGFARSVATNALRKLESAGVIDSHSLGMKGCMIRGKVAGWRQMLLKAISA